MNSGVSDPCLIGIDWGTSSLRAFLIERCGKLLDMVVAPQGGILHVEGRNFDAVFHQLVCPWLQGRTLPIIASGMITSRNGWYETPYIHVPSDARELAKNLVRYETSSGIKLWFITGLTTERSDIPDVMRGEETQIVGATSAGMGDGLYVTPGTHSKWITVSGSRIQHYATYMTGEIFHVLKSHTILNSLMAEGPFSEAGFKLGTEAGFSGAGNLLHRLFSVRTLPLFDRIDPEMVADYLSGLLIGVEIKAATDGLDDPTVVIVGRGDLSDRYTLALALAGLKSLQAPENIVAQGHLMIARIAGLLS